MKKDIEKICCDCNKPFIWTIKTQENMEKLVEQGVFKELIPPRRCFQCKENKKAYSNK